MLPACTAEPRGLVQFRFSDTTLLIFLSSHISTSQWGLWGYVLCVGGWGLSFCVCNKIRDIVYHPSWVVEVYLCSSPKPGTITAIKIRSDEINCTED